jgi:hypothetical protein
MQCSKHPFDRASDICAHCGATFCRPCLVYPGGQKRAALCVPCTISRAGIRARGMSKPIKPRAWRTRRRQLQAALRSAPDTHLRFVELAEIPYVPESEILVGVGRKTNRQIDWCA